MDISHGNSGTSGGSNNLMVHKKKPKNAGELGVKRRSGLFRAKDLPQDIQNRFLVNVKTGALTAREKEKDLSKTGRERAEAGKETTARQVGREEPITKEQPKERDVINLTPKKGLQAPNEEGVIDLTGQGQREKTLAEKLGPIGIVGAGAAIGAGLFFGGTAIAGKVAAGKTAQIIGQKAIEKGGQAFGTAAHFATNTKSLGLTKSLLSKAGMSTRALIAIGAAVGSYPFALFQLAEASDKIGIAMFQAAKNGDEEEVLRLVEVQEEMLDLSVWEKIVLAIPVANVAQSVIKNIKAALESADSFRGQALKEIEKRGEESDFARQRRESDEAAFERKREFGEEESQRFEDIREEGETRKEEEDTAESERFADIEEENRQAKLREQELDSQYFRLIREKKFDEAEELLQSRIRGEA